MMSGTAKSLGDTKIYGLLADPITHLKASSAINRLFARNRYNAICIPLHVKDADLHSSLNALRHIQNFSGFIISIPHKIAVASLCDNLLNNAQSCGSVNVIRKEDDGCLTGEMFDGIGMVNAISAKHPLQPDDKVLLIGAGGTGRAIACALASRGISHLAIANRTRSKATELARIMEQTFAGCKPEVVEEFDPTQYNIIVNATSQGLSGKNSLSIDMAKVSESTLVADVIMTPEMTPFLKAAKDRGLKIVFGHEMMDCQGKSFIKFFGIKPHNQT